MNVFSIISVIIYYLTEFIVSLAGSAGTSAVCFAVGYTYANVVRYRAEHDGELDFVEVLRQMSPKSKKDDEDLEVEYISETNQDDEIEIIGDNEELV